MSVARQSRLGQARPLLIDAGKSREAFALADAYLAPMDRGLLNQDLTFAWHRAWVHYEAGERDAAIEWMTRATAERKVESWLAQLDAMKAAARS